MSLTNSYWDASRKNSGVQETWLIQLYYDDETNFIGLSDKDITISSVQYNGIVIDSGVIVNTIDLVKSQATTDNVDITLRNVYKNQSFAKELIFGSRKYINRKVKIYSRMGDATALTDCQLLDIYRLYNIIQNDNGTVTLQIEKKSVWDHIAIPSLKDDGVYYPVAYGDFEPQGIDNITGDNRVEGNDSDMSSATNHNYEADPTNPPTTWDINTTVSGKLYLALSASDLMGIRHKVTSNLFSPLKTYNISFKGRTASGSGAKLYFGSNPNSAAGGTIYTQATTGTESTYTGTFTLGTGETQFYIFAVADIGTATQAFEIDDLSITYTGSDTVTNNKRMYPTNYMPAISGSDRFAWAVSKSAASGAEPYYYDSSTDQLQKMTNASTLTTSHSNGDYIYFDNLNRSTTLRPVNYSSAHADYSNESNLVDNDITTYTDVSITHTQSTISQTKSITLEFPSIPETTANAKLYIKGAWEITSYTGGGSFTFDVSIKTGGVVAFGESVISNTTVSTKVGIINKASFQNDTGITLEYEDFTGTYGDITIDCIVSRATHITGTYAVVTNFRIYDAYFEVDVQPDYSSDPETESLERKRITSHGYTLWYGDVRKNNYFIPSEEQINQSKQSNICTAIDGFTQGYMGGSGLAENVHEVYRDLLQRYTGFDVADASLIGWSDLNSDRSDWSVRWWQLEPLNLKSILDKLQYEGCFIFKFYQDGGKFIYVKDDPSVDKIATIRDGDYQNIDMKLSDFSELVTHTEYNYEKHPAKGNYISSSTYTNSTSRTTWWPSIATEENKKNVNLDILVKNPYSVTDTQPNDCIALYYDNIISEPKIIVECEIVNKALFNLEDGDIVQFNTSSSSVDVIQPYGKDWADIYFMITKTKRSLNALKISARYVYSI